MKKIRIDRNKWVRAYKGRLSYTHDAKIKNILGTSLMLNEKGNMCCLGHICHQVGVPKKSLYFQESPVQVKHSRVPAAFRAKDDDNRFEPDLVGDAIEINDNQQITGKQREAQLKKLFKGYYDLEFYGRVDEEDQASR